MTKQDKLILSTLLKEVKDKSLQNTLRRVVLGGERAVDVITFERPEMNNEDMKKLKTEYLTLSKCSTTYEYMSSKKYGIETLNKI